MTDRERLTHLARKALTGPHFTGILLCAPPGAGKTTLSEQVASDLGRPVLRLKPSLLYSACAGDVEAAVEAFFASAVAVAPAVVLIDHIDVVAPAVMSGPADRRAVAALDASFDSLSLDSRNFNALVILANASSVRDIHPVLLRSSRFSVHMHIYPPNWWQRRELLVTFVRKEAQRSSATNESQLAASEDSSVPSAELDNIASMTPGFLPADLVGLFSAAVHDIQSSGFDRPDPSDYMRKLVTRMESLVASVRPTLLCSVGASWHPIQWDPRSAERLHGLPEQLGLLRSCVQSAFSHCGHSSGCNVPFKALHALGAIAGVVLTGPPGSGKTALARAAVTFLPRGYVNAFYLDSSEIVGSVVGSAEQKLRALFSIARSTAPTILVIENIDILAHRRDREDVSGSSSAAAFQRILSTLLVELDGIVQHNNAGGATGIGRLNRGALLVIATTSDIARVDPAILRPGRLELHIELCLPDESARHRILCDSVRRLAPYLLPDVGQGESKDWLRAISRRTRGWSAPDLQGLCNEAGLSALRDLKVSGVGSTDDLLTELKLSREHFFDAMRALNVEEIRDLSAELALEDPPESGVHSAALANNVPP